MSWAKRKKPSGRFTMLREDIYLSPAWLSLPANPRCVWQFILQQYNGYNNGDIAVSVRDAAKNVLITKSTAGRAIHDLIDRGFIKVTVNSGFSMKSGRRARRFALTHEPLNNRRATNEWRKWEDPKSERGPTRGTARSDQRDAKE